MSELQDPDCECGAVDHDEIADPLNLNVSRGDSVSALHDRLSSPG
jgi:hypothetical protein